MCVTHNVYLISNLCSTFYPHRWQDNMSHIFPENSPSGYDWMDNMSHISLSLVGSSTEKLQRKLSYSINVVYEIRRSCSYGRKYYP